MTDAGFVFGVYGHTVKADGVFIDELGRFAMIDALDRKQYLELIFQDNVLEKPNYRVVSF